jgi:hypothetical protein
VSEERAANNYYIIGNDPTRWRTRVARYGRVRYAAVYPGVDLVDCGNGGELEYDWVVAPGADPRRIQLRLVTAGSLRLDKANGDLELEGAAGEIRLHSPMVYQMRADQRVVVEARYILAGNADVTGTRSTDFPLVHPLPAIHNVQAQDAFVAKIRMLRFQHRDADEDLKLGKQAEKSCRRLKGSELIPRFEKMREQ